MLTAAGAGYPFTATARVLLETPPAPDLASVKSPKSSALPNVEVVIKSIVLTYPVPDEPPPENKHF